MFTCTAMVLNESNAVLRCGSQTMQNINNIDARDGQRFDASAALALRIPPANNTADPAAASTPVLLASDIGATILVSSPLAQLVVESSALRVV